MLAEVEQKTEGSAPASPKSHRPARRPGSSAAGGAEGNELAGFAQLVLVLPIPVHHPRRRR
jgi:hypothetical protein